MGARRRYLCTSLYLEVNKEIEEVRRGERRIKSGNSDTWIIVSKTGSAEIKPFFFLKRWGSKTRKEWICF